MLNGYSDKTLLDYLQQLIDKSDCVDGVIMSKTIVDWGFVLHGIGQKLDGTNNVRQAIINYIEERKRNYQPTEPSGKEVR